MPPPYPITAVVHDGTVRVSSDLPVPWWSFGKSVLASAALALGGAKAGSRSTSLSAPSRSRFASSCSTSLVRSYSSLPAYHATVAAGETPWPVEDMLRRSGADTLMHELGQGWAYSNISHLFVRELIEESSDAPLDVALERFVFGPLGIAGVTVAKEPAELEATAWGNAQGYHPDGSNTGCSSARRVRRCCCCTGCSLVICCRRSFWRLCGTAAGSAGRLLAFRGGRPATALG